ncbi:MAG TPA: DUF2461 domain-containing protein [Solirubrobacteraceae bacterium]|nr:DUF2461 domain-containing protein [Solirubrobacteraceae bacterium]
MWPPAALEFLRDLEENNDRAWFKANRRRYDEYLMAPARVLAETLSSFGEPRFFRPYRDTRFRPGPPIKEQFGVAIGYSATGGYYVELSLDGLFVGAGLYQPAPDQLERFRAAIDDTRRAAGFERALAAAQAGGLTPAEPALKRAPKGYPSDHPRIDHLRMKTLTVSRRHALESWLHTPECDRRIAAELDASRPLVTWIAQTIGPSHPG